MIISWLPDSTNYPLMGEVVEDTGRFYRVRVTAGSKRSHEKLVGRHYLILKEKAQVMK